MAKYWYAEYVGKCACCGENVTYKKRRYSKKPVPYHRFKFMTMAATVRRCNYIKLSDPYYRNDREVYLWDKCSLE